MNKIVTFGVYDYFHLGHLRLFEQAKKYGDYLIVACPGWGLYFEV